MKKIIRYMQDQALQHSDHRYSGTSYLAPPGKEPQQRVSHRNQHYRSQHISHAQSRSSHPSAHAHSLPAYASGANGPNPIPGDVTRVQYAQDNILQSYDVYLPNPTPDISNLNLVDADRSGQSTPNGAATPLAGGTHSPSPKYWILYIHGGYFRDPCVTSSSFNAALSLLATSASHPSALSHSDYSDIRPHIAGYASINYRLSAHPAHPQDPERTSSYELRNAVWPQHLHDVLLAIKHLQAKHGFGERYLLAGHSIGATMALLAALQSDTYNISIAKPLVVLGVCGIYDFPALHRAFPDYVSITRNAIQDPKQDVEASPARYKLAQYEKIWSKGKRRWVLLAHSRRDGLVDWSQVERMVGVFDADGDGDGARRVSQASTLRPGSKSSEQEPGGREILADVIEVEGKHNDVWSGGSELARVLADGVREMMCVDQ